MTSWSFSYIGAELTKDSPAYTWEVSKVSADGNDESMLTGDDEDAMKHILKLRQVNYWSVKQTRKITQSLTEWFELLNHLFLYSISLYYSPNETVLVTLTDLNYWITYCYIQPPNTLNKK